MCSTKHHAIKTYVEVEVELHVFLTHYMELNVVSFTPRQLYLYPWERRLDGSQSLSGRGLEKKNSVPPRSEFNLSSSK
jgi:hypothetical protein